MKGAGRAEAISAGKQPGDRVHPVVVIDLGAKRPQKLTDELVWRIAADHDGLRRGVLSGLQRHDCRSMTRRVNRSTKSVASVTRFDVASTRRRAFCRRSAIREADSNP